MKPKLLPIIRTNTDLKLLPIINEIEKFNLKSEIELCTDSNNNYLMIFNFPGHFFFLLDKTEIGRKLKEEYIKKRQFECIDIGDNIHFVPFIDYKCNKNTTEELFTVLLEKVNIIFNTKDYHLSNDTTKTDIWLPRLNRNWSSGMKNDMGYYEASFYLRNLGILNPSPDYYSWSKDKFLKQIDKMIAKYLIFNKTDFLNFVYSPEKYNESHGNFPPRSIPWRTSHNGQKGVWINYKTFLENPNFYPPGKIISINDKFKKEIQTFNLSIGDGPCYLILLKDNPNISFYYEEPYNQEPKSYLLFNLCGIEIPRKRGKSEKSVHYKWAPKEEGKIFEQNILLTKENINKYLDNKEDVIEFNNFVIRLYNFPNSL